MLEDSASEHISYAAQRKYQDVPAAKFVESGRKAQPVFVSSTETVATVLTNIAKIGALASLPIGIVLLNSYLRDEGAPLPAADTSISVLLSLVCVIFLFITLILASIFLLPTFATIFDSSKSGTATDSFPHKQKRQIARLVFREYGLRFGPFFCGALFFFLKISLIEKHGCWWLAPIISLVCLVLYLLIWRFTRYGKLDFVLWSSMTSMGSFLALLLIILAVIGQVNPNIPAWGIALCVLIPLVVHFFTVWRVTDWKAAVALYVVILLIITFVWPGSGFLGGLTLRYIGIGGTIPVSIRVKTYARTEGISGVDEITGCLVLMTGGDVLIRPTEQKLDCKLHPQSMTGQTLNLIQTYSRVERYPRADVLRVSKFPDLSKR